MRFHLGRAVAVEITGRDVTRIRAAEDAGRRLTAQLEGLVAGSPDGICLIDDQDRVAVINDMACTLLELAMAPAELVGQSPDVVLSGLRRLLADPSAGIARLREVGEQDEPHRFIPLECADGRRISADYVPLKDGGRLWLFRDITQFKLAEQEQREFLATMSHEIKTPLSGIAGAAELLQTARSGGARARAGRGDRRRRAGAQRAAARRARRLACRGAQRGHRHRRLRPAPAADLDRRRAAPEPARARRSSCAWTSTPPCRTRCTATPPASARSCSTSRATRSSTPIAASR